MGKHSYEAIFSSNLFFDPLTNAVKQEKSHALKYSQSLFITSINENKISFPFDKCKFSGALFSEFKFVFVCS